MKKITTLLLITALLLCFLFTIPSCEKKTEQTTSFYSLIYEKDLVSIRSEFTFTEEECAVFSKFYAGMPKTEFNNLMETLDTFVDMTSSNLGDYITRSSYFLNNYPRTRIVAVCYLPSMPDATGGELFELLMNEVSAGETVDLGRYEKDLLIKSVYFLTEDGRQLKLF